MELKLYNEDCLEAMKDLEDKSVDMILCDLPYGTTQNEWDILIPFEYFDDVLTIEYIVHR